MNIEQQYIFTIQIKRKYLICANFLKADYSILKQMSKNILLRFCILSYENISQKLSGINSKKS